MSIIFGFMMISFTIFLAVAGFAIIQDKKSALNRVFFLLNMSFAVYAFATGFTFIASNKASCDIWTKINSIGIFSFAAFTLHFSLIYTQKKSLLKKWWVYLVIYFPFVFFTVMQFATGFYAKDFVHTRFGWHPVINNSSALFWIFNLYYIVFCGIGVALFIVKWKNSKSVREKKQAATISLASLFTLIISGVIYTIAIFYPTVPNLAPVTTTLWALGIIYGIAKYKLLVITPELAAEQILETITESVIIVNKDGDIISANRETGKLLGYTDEEIYGKPLDMLYCCDNEFRKDNIDKLFKECPIKNMEGHFITKKKKKIPIILSASECRDKTGDLLGYIVVTRDITNIKEAEERLNYLAHHDILTSLPNRLLFVDRFNQEAAKAARNKTSIAVFLLDLDHFKQINDTYGHGVGDQLLVEVSERMKASIRQSDSIARLGGDEFVILLSDLKDKTDYKATAGRIVNNVAKPYIIDNNELNITISVGVSIYPDSGSNLDSLLKNSDIAMYSVKSGGRNNFKLFTSLMNEKASQSLDIEKDLKSALANNELLLYYQPMVDLYSGTIIGTEALVRWKHPKYGIISPADFIPQAEETGLIVPLGEWVLKTACNQAKKWQESNLSPIYMSVNLSSFQFKEKSLSDTVLKILDESKLDPKNLLLEITESNVMRDRENVGIILRKMYEHGVRIIISGFGTGYSSLLYLKDFPIYAIKIDRFFIRNITNDIGCATIVKAIISLAHDLDVKVIAEGIETSEQLEYLRSLEWKPANPIKCDGAQGFLFSRPLSEEAIEALIKTNNKTIKIDNEG